MNRDFAEKQELWAEMGELWAARQSRRRRCRLTFAAVVSVALLAGAYVYTGSAINRDPLYLHVQGQSLQVQRSADDDVAVGVKQREDRIEIADTISI